MPFAATRRTARAGSGASSAGLRFGGELPGEAPSNPPNTLPVQALGGARSVRIASARVEQRANVAKRQGKARAAAQGAARAARDHLEEEEGLWDKLKEDRRRYKQ